MDNRAQTAVDAEEFIKLQLENAHLHLQNLQHNANAIQARIQELNNELERVRALNETNQESEADGSGNSE